MNTADIIRHYQGWTRPALMAQGMRGTLSMATPGTGTAVSWLGFNAPTVGSVPPTSWIQLGLNANGHPYLEYQQPGQKSVYQEAPVVSGPLDVRLVHTPKGWQAYLGQKLWLTVMLKAALGQMFAGGEWFDNATTRMTAQNLNTYEGGKWVPFRHATKVSR